MRVIAKKRLIEFWGKNKKSKQPLAAWYYEAKKAHWKNPAEIKQNYKSASILKDNRVVFNISGNSFRLIVKINYKFGIIYIRFIGTHSEYDNINAEEI